MEEKEEMKEIYYRELENREIYLECPKCKKRMIHYKHGYVLWNRVPYRCDICKYEVIINVDDKCPICEFASAFGRYYLDKEHSTEFECYKVVKINKNEF